jgi:hypothetical protein
MTGKEFNFTCVLIVNRKNYLGGKNVAGCVQIINGRLKISFQHMVPKTHPVQQNANTSASKMF